MTMLNLSNIYVIITIFVYNDVVINKFNFWEMKQTETAKLSTIYSNRLSIGCIILNFVSFVIFLKLSLNLKYTRTPSNKMFNWMWCDFNAQNHIDLKRVFSSFCHSVNNINDMTKSVIAFWWEINCYRLKSITIETVLGKFFIEKKLILKHISAWTS